MKQNRHNARIITLQKLFELSFTDSELNDISQKQLYSEPVIAEIDDLRTDQYDADFSKQVFNGVVKQSKNIDQLISILAPDWPIDKIAKVDLQILRIAIYEGFISCITPEKVAIDEAVELTKEFSNERSRKFVNGVLGSLIENKTKFVKLLTNS